MALSESEYKFIAYRPLNILCMLYFNLKDLTRLQKYHKVFLNIKDETIEHDVLDYNYRIYINILAENHQTALHLIDGLLNKHCEYLNDQKGSYIINKIMIASVIEDFDLCYKLLEEYKSTGGFKLRSNYKYIVSILNYLTKNAPIYAYKRDFENSEYLYQQLCLIKNLELNNHKEAKDNWNYFHTKWPERFGENFEYLSSKDMFSMALDKALKKTQFKNITGPVTFNQSELDQFKALPEKLNYLLSSPNHIFTKDELIEYIWGEKWTPKNDDRLRKLISRTQKKYAIKVQNLDGKYKKVA